MVKEKRSLFTRLVDGSVYLVNKLMPDSFLFAIILTLIVLIVAIPVTGIAPGEGITTVDRIINLIYKGWYGGFWGLLAFTMQMVLIVVTGSVFAQTPFMTKVIDRLTSVPKTPRQGVLLVAAVGCVGYFVQWGAAMIVCAILAKEVAKKVPGSHYALLIAAANMGNALWHGGISGTIPLKIAVPFEFAGMWSTQGIPFAQTVFAPYNLFIYIAGAVVLCTVITMMHPSPEKTITISKELIEKETLPPRPAKKAKSEMTIAERIENSVFLNKIIGLMGVFCFVWYFIQMKVNGQAFSLSIDMVNFIFLFLAIVLYETPMDTVRAFKRAVGGVSGMVLQFPFYAAIAGLMGYAGGSNGVSIAQEIARFFVNVSNTTTFPLFTFISAGIVKMFVPSGGAHWTVQGPIIMNASQSFLAGVSEGKAAMSLAWGNCWGNLLQPFWIMPILDIAGLKVRDVMGYCVVAAISLALVIMTGLVLIPG